MRLRSPSSREPPNRVAWCLRACGAGHRVSRSWLESGERASDDLCHGGGIVSDEFTVGQAALPQILGHLRGHAAQRGLRSGYLLERNRVQKSAGQRLHQYDLLQDRNGSELRLCQAGTNPLTVSDQPLGMLIEARAEARKGLQFLELGIRELQLSGNCAVGRALCSTAYPRNGFGDVDRWQDTQLEQRW